MSYGVSVPDLMRRLFTECDEVSNRAREPIELRAHHHVDLAPPDSLQERVEARATLPGSAHAVVEVLSGAPVSGGCVGAERLALAVHVLL